MRHWKFTAIMAAAFMVIGLGNASAATTAKTTKGTMSLGGTISFDIDVVMPSEGDSVMGFKLNVAPDFGYFISDNLELRAKLGFGKRFGDLYELDTTTDLSFGAGVIYYLGINANLKLGVGVEAGMQMGIPEEGDSSNTLHIGVPIQLLVPLKDTNVALIAGTTINVTMGLEDGAATNIGVPIGYLGVKNLW